MTRLIERSFDPGRPVIVRKSFTANGRKLGVGNVWNWKQTAVNQRRVKQLFDMGNLLHPKLNDVLAIPLDAPITPPVVVEGSNTPAEADDLDAIDNMIELRTIADAEGAPTKSSKVLQRQAIRDHRAQGEAEVD